MTKIFRPYDTHQQLLFPPDLQDWLPEGHLARFVSELVENALDLSSIYAVYDAETRGGPPYHPAMLVKLLIYGYCTGVRSSRQIERATYDDLPFRFLSANQHPDHDSISDFRKRHLKLLAGFFVQVLMLCGQAGLVKLGHVSIDGTKMKANASKHKAMSYQRMVETEKRLKEEVRLLLEDAKKEDESEDQKYGKGQRGDDLPAELKRREDRLKKIAEAKAALELHAREKASQEAEVVREKLEARAQKERERGKKTGGRPPKVPDPAKAEPDPKAQRNFTDPESRIMLDGATKGFIQGYNAQIAVDSESQIVVAALVSQIAADSVQLIPVMEAVLANMEKLPEKVSADAGYFSNANVTDPALADVDLFIPPGLREKNLDPDLGPVRIRGPVAEGMHLKLKAPEGHAVYKRRKAIVEPVFGQIKDARGIRAFLFRGVAKVAAEWDLICLTHNLLKLFRSGFKPQLRLA